MTDSLDSLGYWVSLGSVKPSDEWQNFPVLDSGNSNLFRISHSGISTNISQVAWLRYSLNDIPAMFSSNWIQIFSKFESEFIELPIIFENSISRRFQIKSKSSRLSQWTVTLDRFIPNDSQSVLTRITELESQVNQLQQDLEQQQQKTDTLLQNLTTIIGLVS